MSEDYIPREQIQWLGRKPVKDHDVPGQKISIIHVYVTFTYRELFNQQRIGLNEMSNKYKHWRFQCTLKMKTIAQ